MRFCVIQYIIIVGVFVELVSDFKLFTVYADDLKLSIKPSSTNQTIGENVVVDA